MSFYEKHIYSDSNFPIIFHKDFLSRDLAVPIHWHENMELLLITEGSGFVLSDARRIECKAGNLVVIDSNNIHTVHPYNQGIGYYCLIIGRSYCDDIGIKHTKTYYCNPINDSKINEIFYDIDLELKEQPPYYKVRIKALVSCLIVRLQRFYLFTTDQKTNIRNKNAKIDLVKKAIEYIMGNYKSHITIDKICENISFTKYYLCHTFKEITGQSVMDYINLMRCQNAKNLILSGQYSIKECAELSGFNNPSAFSITFKKYMGVLPSQLNKQENIIRD